MFYTFFILFIISKINTLQWNMYSKKLTFHPITLSSNDKLNLNFDKMILLVKYWVLSQFLGIYFQPDIILCIPKSFQYSDIKNRN